MITIFFRTAALILFGVSAACAQPNLGSSTSNSDQQIPKDRQQSFGAVDVTQSLLDRFADGVGRFFGFDASSPVEWDGNQSPRETVLSFVQGMDQVLYRGEDQSEKIENTLPSGYFAESEEVLFLKQFFDRLGTLHPSVLPSQKSQLVKDTKRFEVFPYAVDHTWMWKALDEPPKGSVVLEKVSENQWKFTRETLEGAKTLLDSVASIPPIYETVYGGQSRSLFLPAGNESPWWSWIVAGLGLIVAVYGGKKIRKWLIKIGDKSQEDLKPMLGSLIRSIATSVAIVVGTIIFVLCSVFIEMAPTLSNAYWQLIKVIFLVALIWIIFGLTDLVATVVRHHLIGDEQEYGEMTVTIVQRIIRTILFIIVAVFVLENVFGLSVGSLLTGLGVLGLALSLAGKETAQNLFGAISIFINRPFVVGDWIQFNDQIGQVKDVRMQATYIRILDGEMLIVPNMQFIAKEVENLSMRTHLRREMNISIPYATSAEKVDKAMEILESILSSDDIVQEGKCDMEERPPKIAFDQFGPYYLNIKVYYWYIIGDKGEDYQRNHERGWFTFLDHCTLVNRQILCEFNKAGIEFAFPTQTLALGRASEGALSA